MENCINRISLVINYSTQIEYLHVKTVIFGKSTKHILPGRDFNYNIYIYCYDIMYTCSA